MKEIILNLVFVLFAGFLWVIAENYSGVQGITQGAGTFPRIIISILFFFAGWNIIQCILTLVKKNGTRQKSQITKTCGTNTGIFKYKEVTAVCLVAVYYFLLELIGFIPATLFFIPAMLYITAYRKKITVLIITVCGTFFLYVIFKILLGVPLPAGLLFS